MHHWLRDASVVRDRMLNIEDQLPAYLWESLLPAYLWEFHKVSVTVTKAMKRSEAWVTRSNLQMEIAAAEERHEAERQLLHEARSAPGSLQSVSNRLEGEFSTLETSLAAKLDKV
jgi:hypothetical protein